MKLRPQHPPQRRRGSQALQAFDVLLAASFVVSSSGEWNYRSVANRFGVSTETVHSAVQRLARARLYNSVRRRIVRSDLLEFLEHGVRFVFPAQVDERRVRGILTGVSAPPLADKILAGDDAAVVWASADGTAYGRELAPLHHSAPRVALHDKPLHELLALIDAMRIGGARERELAREQLRSRLS